MDQNTIASSLNDTITVVFPIGGSELDLPQMMSALIGELSALTKQFEIIIVDDATDSDVSQTILATRQKYPQIRVLRNSRKLGPNAATDIGLKHANGNLVVVHESYEPIDLSELRQLWELRHDPKLVMARARTRTKRIDSQLVDKLIRWGERYEKHWEENVESQSELHLFRKDAIESIQQGRHKGEKLEVTHRSHQSIVSPKRDSYMGAKGAAGLPSV